jgi:hypothetical protein
MADEDGFPTIGGGAESILCAGIFDDAGDDFDIRHKFTFTKSELFGGNLNVDVTKEGALHMRSVGTVSDVVVCGWAAAAVSGLRGVGAAVACL